MYRHGRELMCGHLDSAGADFCIASNKSLSLTAPKGTVLIARGKVSGDECVWLRNSLLRRSFLLRCFSKADKTAAMKTRLVFLLVAATTLICAGLSYGQEAPMQAVPAATPPDATLFTTYNIDTAHTTVSLVVCGSLPGSSGCYGSASLGPFGKVGALLEGDPKIDLSANTVTRAIYVLDIASGANQNEVVLDVYTKVDTITTDFDTVTVTLSQTISLPLVGSTSALASMAANKQFLFIGTNRTPNAVELNKRTLTIAQLGGFSPPINVFAITADQYGYVTLSYGSFNGFDNAFIVVDPNGNVFEDGGGSQFMLNTVQGVLPSTFR